jgi:hypothetical protein
VWHQVNSVTDPKFTEKMQSLGQGLAKAKQVGARIPGETEGMSGATTDRKEVEALKILLEYNAKLLAPEWLAKNKPPPTFTASFIVPLKKKTMSHEAGQKENERLCVCGANNPKLKCTRCSSVWYCGKSCQVADWKTHKKVCKSPQERAADADTVIVRVGRHDPILEGMGGRYLCARSLHASSSELVAQLDGSRHRVLDMFQPLSVPAGEGASFIAKIQTPPAAGAPMLVYDKGKNFQTFIHPDNASPAGYQKIFGMIQSGSSGRKGYFSASLQAGGTELHVYASALLPVQSW